jgi:DNA polymerase-3 subunit beta
VKITIEPDVLASAVGWTAPSLAKRPQMPALAGIKLDAEGPELAVSAFDYDTSAECRVPVEPGEDGVVLVPGRLLAEIVKSLPPRPVTLQTDGSRATLACGPASFSLLTMPLGDYPDLPAMPEPAGTLGSAALEAAVRQVATAAGADDTLPMLTGVRIEIDGDDLTFIATDRYRLAVRKLKWVPVRPDLFTAFVVPARTLEATAKALTAGAEVAISLSQQVQDGPGGEGMIGFEGAGRQTTTRLLGGDLPRYEALLPKVVNGVAELAAGPFAEAVKRVALVAERNTAVRLSFSAGQLVLEAGTGDEAQATEVLEASYEGDGIQIAFNPQYLLDGLTAIDSGIARIAFTEPGKPALITGAVAEGETPEYRYLLMPIRLGS